MGKEKNKRKMVPSEGLQKFDSEIDYSRTQSFLSSAISDIAGHTNVFDTKVSIVMAALGVIISGLINCWELLYDSYKCLERGSMLYISFCFILFLFCISMVLVYFWGVQTIRTHACNISFKSLWFIREKQEEYPFEIYKSDIENLTVKDIINNMSAELFKLNDIYRQKQVTTRRTVSAFAVALTMLLLDIGICIGVSIL